MTQALEKTRFIPRHLFLGIGLVGFFWFASWTRLGLAGEYSFFPLWLGYILTVDALVALRRGSSLITRAPLEFIALFAVSAPAWWIFEFMNYFVSNWHYIGAETYSNWHIIVEASITFSTVIPAVFETTELVSTFGFIQNLRSQRRISISPRTLWIAMYAGAFGFAALVLAPAFAFGVTWIWLFLLLDPLNALRNRASLIEQIARGEWRQLIALTLGVLICGFFWEMWNFYAMPKWFYTVPIFNFGRIFEMPVLGYSGYIPFGWELFALYHFVWGVLRRQPQMLESKFI